MLSQSGFGFFAGLTCAVLVALPSKASADADFQFPCKNLPSDAVMQVPAPFDQYMELTCTKAGQALRPKPGFRFIFQNGMSLDLTALNFSNPIANPSVHFTMLSTRNLSDTAMSKFREQLRVIVTDMTAIESRIIWMDERTSTDATKQIILLIPPAGSVPERHVLGMECITECIPIDKDPWLFSIVPEAELQAAPTKQD